MKYNSVIVPRRLAAALAVAIGVALASCGPASTPSGGSSSPNIPVVTNPPCGPCLTAPAYVDNATPAPTPARSTPGPTPWTGHYVVCATQTLGAPWAFCRTD
jgi:hypothetical protein